MQTISIEDAAAQIQEGVRLLIDGCMAVGTSESVMDEIERQGERDLMAIGNDTAT